MILSSLACALNIDVCYGTEAFGAVVALIEIKASFFGSLFCCLGGGGFCQR